MSLAALTLLSRRKADEKYLHIFVGLSAYIIIFLGSNKITMLYSVWQKNVYDFAITSII